MINEAIFPAYREQNGQLVPTGRVDKRSGEAISDLKYLDVVFNASLTDDDFKKLPDGEFNHSTVIALLDGNGVQTGNSSQLGQADPALLEKITLLMPQK